MGRAETETPERIPARPRKRRQPVRRVAGVTPARVAPLVIAALLVAAIAFVVVGIWHPWAPDFGPVPADLKGALAYWTRVTEAQPSNADAWYRRGLTEVQTGMAKASVTHLRKAASLSPADASYADALARGYMSLARYAEAAAIWERLGGDSGAAAAVRTGWLDDAAEARLQGGDVTRAKVDAQRALKLTPTDPRALNLSKGLK